MVSRGEAEAGVCDIALNAGRVGVISYSMQVATFQYVIVCAITYQRLNQMKVFLIPKMRDQSELTYSVL